MDPQPHPPAEHGGHRSAAVGRSWRWNDARSIFPAFAWALFLPAGGALAQSDEVRIFDAARDAVVQIEAVDAHGRLRGTGFFIDPTGTLLTSYTIGGNSTELHVLVGPVKLPARRLVADPRSGVALLKVDAETPALALGSDELPAAQSPVVAIGYPMGGPVRAIGGEVAGIAARHGSGFFATRHLHVAVDALFGMGGAPVLDRASRVVGIVIGRADSGVGCYALPIGAAEKVRADYLRFGEVREGWMGVELTGAGGGSLEFRATVDLVVPHGPASQAGLEQGDVLLQIGEMPIRHPGDILDATFFLTAGDEVPVRVRRAGQELLVQVRPRLYPSEAAEPTQAADAGEALALPGSAGSTGFPEAGDP